MTIRPKQIRPDRLIDKPSADRSCRMSQLGAAMHEYKAFKTCVVHHAFYDETFAARYAPPHTLPVEKQIVGIPLA